MAQNTYSVYVCRKRVGETDYIAALIEGNKAHVHITRKEPISEDPKGAYIESYAWIVRILAAAFNDGKLPAGDVVFYTHNLTFSHWLLSYTGEDYSKPPVKYRELVESVYSAMENLGTNYDMRVVKFNRAAAYATEAAWQKQQRENKPEKAVDAFSDWDIEE